MRLIILLIILLMSAYGNSYDKAKQAEKEKNYKLSEKLYREACDSGNDKGCLGLTNLYFNGKGELGSMKIVYKLSNMLCDKNNAEGCFFLGYLYAEGKGINVNMEEAKKQYAKACQLKEDKACSNLAKIYMESKEYTQAIKYYEKSYSIGNYVAAGILGSFYSSGIGVVKDLKKAKEYHKPACDKGNISSSCAVLGVIYIQSNDFVLAKKYTEKACNAKELDTFKNEQQHISEACMNLGSLYYKGYGVEQSYIKARKLYRKACDMGLDMACKRYNIMYQQ